MALSIDWKRPLAKFNQQTNMAREMLSPSLTWFT